MARSKSSTATATRSKKAPAAKSAATRAPAKPAGRTKSGAQPSHERIAQRAFEIWIERGCPVGTENENWALAQKQLIAEG